MEILPYKTDAPNQLRVGLISLSDKVHPHNIFDVATSDKVKSMLKQLCVRQTWNL